MTNSAEIESKFWKALKSERTMMLGLGDPKEDYKDKVAEVSLG